MTVSEKDEWAENKAGHLVGVASLLNLQDSETAAHHAETVTAALLEADKRGYERGRKDAGSSNQFLCSMHGGVASACYPCTHIQKREDEALLRDCLSAFEDLLEIFPCSHSVANPKCGCCRADELLSRLESRLGGRS